MISSDFSKYEFHTVEEKEPLSSSSYVTTGGMVFESHPHSRLNSYMIPMGLIVDNFKHHRGGSGEEGEEEEEEEEIVEMKGGGEEGEGEDWLSSERFDQLFAMATGATKGGNRKNMTKKKKNITKKKTHTNHSSSSWKLW